MKDDNTNEISKRPRLHCQPLDKSKCIFCTKQDGHLHEFMTLDAGDNVRSMATDLQDTQLLTRIEDGDLTAIAAKYHLSCLTELRNRHRSFLRKNHCSDSTFEVNKIEAGAFVEPISHIESSVESGIFCFK